MDCGTTSSDRRDSDCSTKDEKDGLELRSQKPALFCVNHSHHLDLFLLVQETQP